VSKQKRGWFSGRLLQYSAIHDGSFCFAWWLLKDSPRNNPRSGYLMESFDGKISISFAICAFCVFTFMLINIPPAVAGLPQDSLLMNPSPGGQIERLNELLLTVSPAEIGFINLTTSKMRAEALGSQVTVIDVDGSLLQKWLDESKGSDAKTMLSRNIELISLGKAKLVSLEHKVEAFTVNARYSNFPYLANRTRITFTVSAEEDFPMIQVLEMVPVSVSANLSSMLFPGIKPQIFLEDHLLLWNLTNVKKGETRTVAYYSRSIMFRDDIRPVAISISEFESPATAQDLSAQPNASVTNVSLIPEQPPAGSDADSAAEEPSDALLPIPESLKVDIMPLLWPMAILAVLAATGLAGYSIYKHKKNSVVDMNLKVVQHDTMVNIRTNVAVPDSILRDAEKFILSRMKQGVDDALIKKPLVLAGWDPRAVDLVIHDLHIVETNLEKLNFFIESCLDRGLEKDYVAKSLAAAGWRPDLVSLILDNYK
jgi:hypothetical protein